MMINKQPLDGLLIEHRGNFIVAHNPIVNHLIDDITEIIEDMKVPDNCCYMLFDNTLYLFYVFLD